MDGIYNVLADAHALYTAGLRDFVADGVNHHTGMIVDAIHALDTTRPTTLCPSVHWLREYLDGTPYLTTDEDEWMRDDPERQKADWMHYASIFRSAVNNLPDNEKRCV